jgi:hypothetical protein
MNFKEKIDAAIATLETAKYHIDQGQAQMAIGGLAIARRTIKKIMREESGLAEDTCIAVMGNFSDGFEFVGPFDTFAEGAAWADKQEPMSWIATLSDDPRVRPSLAVTGK